MSTVTKTERLLTAQEYWEQTDDRPTELVEGKVIEMSRPGARHGQIQSRIARLLGNFADERNLPEPFVESGVITKRDPDSVRGPDVMFYSWDRLPDGRTPIGFMTTPANVVFEVLSPSQRLKDLIDKADEYLAAGVLCVCIVDPDRRSVLAYEPDKPIVVLTEQDTLHLPPPLDEWNPHIGDFFPE